MPYTPYQFANGATSTVGGGAGGLGTPLNPGDTTLYLPTGQGSRFPSSGFFMLQVGTTEYVKVTLRATDTLTIQRAQEGTSAGTWPVGTTVQDIVSAQSLNDGMNELATLDSGKANLSGAAFTGNVSTTGTLTITGASSLDGGKITTDGAGNATFGASTSLTVPTLTATTALTTPATINGTSVVGTGVGLVVGLTQDQTVTVTTTVNLCSFTVGGANGLFMVNGYVRLNNGTSGNSISFNYSYTDPGNSARTGSLVMQGGGGTTNTLAATGTNSFANTVWSGTPAFISCKNGTTIQLTYRDPTNTPSDIVSAMIIRLA